MMINVRIMVRSRAPIRYIIQVGGLKDWAVFVAGSAVWGGAIVAGGVI